MAAKEKLNRKQKRERVRQIPWTIFAALVYSIFYIPVLVMILFSFNDAKRNYSWAGFTTKWYPKLFSFGNHDLWESLAYSLIIAVVVTIISVIIGVLGVIALICTLVFKPARILARDRQYRREAGLPEEGLSKSNAEMMGEK